MIDPEQIDNQQKLLRTWRRTLLDLLQKQAIFGPGHAPPSVGHGIDEARANIQRIKDILRDWKAEVADDPNDEPPTAAPDGPAVSQAQQSLDARILGILYQYYESSPGDPQMDLQDLVQSVGAPQPEVIFCLYGLKERKWVEFDLTSKAEAGLVSLTRLGLRVAQSARVR
jgi:hypothetical protein